ncbi:MAG TPA: MarR family winged helix-turn-helix transcriptional regulator [Myxococcota bacterium]|nr:MarR family winged helix-turn-helix transcriptional regulator [Myxococcota bacterium]
MHDTRKILESCACHRLRMAARAVTRSYDDALRPVGLRATQMALLTALEAEGALSISALARLAGMDRSTLSRNLAPLEREGLVALGAEGWRRARTLALTAKGRSRLAEAVPLWEQAQRSLRRSLGARRWDDVRRSLDHVIHSTQ